MKLKKTNKIYNKILTFYLIKNKIYEQSIEKNKFIEINLNKNLIELKKSLNIIFNYDTNKKNILFIGIDKTLKKNNYFKKNHCFIPNSINIKKIKLTQNILNKNFYLSYFKNKFYINKPDLIIFFNNNKLEYKNFIKTYNKLKIPIIQFFQQDINNYFYNISINNNLLSKKNFDNFFFNIINSTLNKNIKKIKLNK